MNTQKNTYLLINNGHGLNIINIDDLELSLNSSEDKLLKELEKYFEVWRIFAYLEVDEVISYRMLFGRVIQDSYLEFMTKVFGQLEIKELP